MTGTTTGRKKVQVVVADDHPLYRDGVVRAAAVAEAMRRRIIE